jgi:FkbM family methyltransferase
MVLVTLFRLNLVKKFKINFKGNEYNITSMQDYYEFWHKGPGNMDRYKGLKISGNSISLTFKGKRLRFFIQNSSPRAIYNYSNLLFEQFTSNQYKVDVRGKIVVDIGAYLGETAVYFTLNGAKKVISLEPYPSAYDLAKKNLAINHVTNKVKLFNYGISGRENIIKIDPKVETSTTSDLKYFSKGKSVKLVPLSTLVKDHNLDNAVLKADCEGAEYDMILGCSDEILRKFSHMVLEYTYGYINLEKRLKKAGFKVSHTGPGAMYSGDADPHNQLIGLICATRID